MAGPKAADLSFDQRLGMIVDREIVTRENKRLARLIREARLRLNAVITGPTGVGKSFIARALGTPACRRGYSTRYYRSSRLLSELNMARADGTYARALRRRGRLLPTLNTRR